jgi:uncharacterized protein (TIGR00369 family)
MRRRVLEWADPMATLSAAVASSGIDYLRGLASGTIPPPPMAVLMNFEIEVVDKGRVTFTATPGEEHYNPHGSVHGGYAATLFDTVLGCAVHSVLEQGYWYTTLELHVNFVRPITRETGRLRCEGFVLHAGKRVATAEAKLTDDSGKLVGHATTTCLISQRSSARSTTEVAAPR